MEKSQKTDPKLWRKENYAKMKIEAEELHRNEQLNNVGNWRVVVARIKREEAEKLRLPGPGNWRAVVSEIKRRESESNNPGAIKMEGSSTQVSERNHTERRELGAKKDEPRPWREVVGEMKRRGQSCYCCPGESRANVPVVDEHPPPKVPKEEVVTVEAKAEIKNEVNEEPDEAFDVEMDESQ